MSASTHQIKVEGVDQTGGAFSSIKNRSAASSRNEKADEGSRGDSGRKSRALRIIRIQVMTSWLSLILN